MKDTENRIWGLNKRIERLEKELRLLQLGKFNQFMDNPLERELRKTIASTILELQEAELLYERLLPYKNNI